MDNFHKKQKKQDKQSSNGRPTEGTHLKENNTQKAAVKKEKPNYKQYFESESDDESEQENDKSRKSVQAVTKVGRQKRKIESDSESEIELESDISSVDEEKSDDATEQKEWQDKCYICKKGGNLICCDGCAQVAHVFCTGLRVKPSGDWHCEDCLYKQSQQRTTRRQVVKQNNLGPGRAARSSRSYRQ